MNPKLPSFGSFDATSAHPIDNSDFLDNFECISSSSLMPPIIPEAKSPTRMQKSVTTPENILYPIEKPVFKKRDVFEQQNPKKAKKVFGITKNAAKDDEEPTKTPNKRQAKQQDKEKQANSVCDDKKWYFYFERTLIRCNIDAIKIMYQNFGGAKAITAMQSMNGDDLKEKINAFINKEFGIEIDSIPAEMTLSMIATLTTHRYKENDEWRKQITNIEEYWYPLRNVMYEYNQTHKRVYMESVYNTFFLVHSLKSDEIKQVIKEKSKKSKVEDNENLCLKYIPIIQTTAKQFLDSALI